MYEHAVAYGATALEEWLLRCVYESGPLICFDTYAHLVFIGKDSLMPLHKMLRLDSAFGVSFQDWFDLIQHAAEETVA